MAGGKNSPRSLRSCSPSSSRSSSPIQLDASTQALLDLFLADKAAEEERFSKLEEEAQLRKRQFAQDDAAEALGLAETDVLALMEKPMMSVKDFREVFREDWQLSQFWYVQLLSPRLS
jgi:EEF1A lysine methyltransferase 1